MYHPLKTGPLLLLWTVVSLAYNISPIKAESPPKYQFYDVKTVEKNNPLLSLEVQFLPASVPVLNLASTAVFGDISITNVGSTALKIRNPMEFLDVQLIGPGGKPVEIKRHPPATLVHSKTGAQPFSAFALKEVFLPGDQRIGPEGADVLEIPANSTVRLALYPRPDRFAEAIPSLGLADIKDISLENAPKIRFTTSLMLVGESGVPGRIIRSDFIPLVSREK